MNRLFVYGTLRSPSNHQMQRYLAQYTTLVGEGTIRGELYDLGNYPGVWIPEGGMDRVMGEVHELNEATATEVWQSLDVYEMCGAADPEPHLYRRETVVVSLADGSTTEGVVYVLNVLPMHARKIPSGDYFHPARDV
jgi:gamma-glutamylcyclotransferase (GGCT)/AIG2-like uncharacterized protein YtfP